MPNQIDSGEHGAGALKIDEGTEVAFVGLGNMGLPMAKNLVEAGLDVVGYDIDETRTAEFAEAGGRGSDSIAAAVRGVDVVITMVRTPDQVQEIAETVFPEAEPGTIFVDMSTVGPETVVELRETGTTHDIRIVDAPVSGGVVGAEEGSLAIMAGGTEADFAVVEPLLNVLGETVVRMGELGAGQTTKLCNQLLVGSQLVSIAEAFRLADAAGLDLETLYDVLTSGVATSGILELKGQRILEEDYEPGADIDIQHKDTQMVMELGEKLDQPLYATAIVAQAFVHARNQGYGDRDHLILYELFADGDEL
jgi:2-hydroxy-3-oxopropionate reductase